MGILANTNTKLTGITNPRTNIATKNELTAANKAKRAKDNNEKFDELDWDNNILLARLKSSAASSIPLSITIRLVKKVVCAPNIVAITKSDLGEVATNTFNDVSNSLKFSILEDKKEIPVINISSKENKNIDKLIKFIDEHKIYNGSKVIREKKKLKKSMFWLEESIKEQFGVNGIKKLKKVRVTNNSPFMQYLDLVK